MFFTYSVLLVEIPFFSFFAFITNVHVDRGSRDGTKCFTGLVEAVWLLWLWPDHFSQSKIIILFLQKASNNKSASVIFGLVKLIILSYNGYKKHTKRCKIIGHPCMRSIYCYAHKAGAKRAFIYS